MLDNLLNLKDTAPVTGFICDQWIERRATIEGLKRGEFETLMPILKSLVVITPEEKAEILDAWIKSVMPNNTKLYSEALTFDDYQRIEITDAVQLAKNQGRN